jgi:hypothetical protein
MEEVHNALDTHQQEGIELSVYGEVISGYENNNNLNHITKNGMTYQL